MVSLYIVTQLVTGYGSTHNALVTIFTMADNTEVASLLQQLLATVASHSDILSVLSAQRNNIADSIVSVDTDVPAEERIPDIPVVPEVDHPAPVQIREDQVRSHFSVTRELGNGIPILSDKNYALWKAHVFGLCQVESGVDKR